jgi:hypothetical protein
MFEVDERFVPPSVLLPNSKAYDGPLPPIMLIGRRIGSVRRPSGMKIMSRVWRYRKKKYASRPHLFMTSRSLNSNIAKSQPNKLVGGDFVLSRSGAK